MANSATSNAGKRIRPRPEPPTRSLRKSLFGSSDPAVVSERILGRRIGSGALSKLQEALGLTREEVAAAIGVSPRTLARREAGQEPLDISEGDRLYRVAEVVDLATEMIGDRTRAFAWIRRRNAALGGEAPLELMRTSIGTAEVERVLYEIGYGGAA